MKCLLTSKCWCCPEQEWAPFTAWRMMVSRKHKRQLHQAVVQKKKMLLLMYFRRSRFSVLLDNSTNGFICLRSTRPRFWAWAVISGEGGRIKMGQNEEGTGKSGGFKEKKKKLWAGERTGEHVRPEWGAKEIKGAWRREKERATKRKTRKGAAGSVWARNSLLWSYGILKRVMDDCFMDGENI